MDLKNFSRNTRYHAGSDGRVTAYRNEDFVGRLHTLLHRHSEHCALAETVRRHLPPALAEHCLGAYAQDGALVLYVQSHIAANRIKMLAPQIVRDMENIRTVTVRIEPPNTPPPRTITPRDAISPESAAALEAAAQQFENDNRPQLAAAFRRMTAALQKNKSQI